MKKSKKIGDLYREKLRDVETTPPEDVWQGIAASLPEKRKNRIFPVWFRFAGAAAVLLLLFGSYHIFWETESFSDAPAVVSPVEEKNYDFDFTSPAFEEAMRTSSAILEALMENTGELDPEGFGRMSTSAEGAVAEAAERDPAEREISMAPEQIDPAESLADLQDDQSEEDPIIPEQNSESDKLLEELAGNTLNEELAKEELTKETELSKRFSITTTAGAVQGGQNSNGGEVSMAYGLNLAYQVSEKIRVRTGVSKLELNSSTRNMSYASGAISEANDDQLLSYAPTVVGLLEQSLGFVEVPLEFEYALINRKIGLNLIAGGSTMFLDKNTLHLNSPIASTNLGEVEHLNNVSFSTNIGLGLNYHLSEDFRLNLEPMFKYQLNMSNISSDFNPYYFGIYSGLSYKF